LVSVAGLHDRVQGYALLTMRRSCGRITGICWKLTCEDGFDKL